jgi:hypothetical protein
MIGSKIRVIYDLDLRTGDDRMSELCLFVFLRA